MKKGVVSLARPEIVKLEAYSSARSLAKAEGILLDANESPYAGASFQGVAVNRYPDPHAAKLRQAIAAYNKLDEKRVVIGNGSDDLIDLVLKIFARWGDNAIIPAPTYPMYEVAAKILGVECRTPLLNDDFSVNLDRIFEVMTNRTKIIFLCSPNNPVGSIVSRQAVEELAHDSSAVVVVDEAYYEFCGKTHADLLEEHENLVILRTLSKAWGLAGLRLGYALACPDAIALFNKVKAPYNVSSTSQELAFKSFDVQQMRANVKQTVDERGKLAAALEKLGFMPFPSQANFITARAPQSANAKEIVAKLRSSGIIVRDRSSLPLLYNCIRFSIGQPQENVALTKALGDVLA